MYVWLYYYIAVWGTLGCAVTFNDTLQPICQLVFCFTATLQTPGQTNNGFPGIENIWHIIVIERKVRKID